jgi:hypothetical protein
MKERTTADVCLEQEGSLRERRVIESENLARMYVDSNE